MFWKIFTVLAVFLTASTAFAQRVSEWHDDLNGSYYSGSGNTDYTVMILGYFAWCFCNAYVGKKIKKLMKVGYVQL